MSENKRKDNAPLKLTKGESEAFDKAEIKAAPDAELALNVDTLELVGAVLQQMIDGKAQPLGF